MIRYLNIEVIIKSNLLKRYKEKENKEGIYEGLTPMPDMSDFRAWDNRLLKDYSPESLI